MPRAGRNEPCPCGSGCKVKNCCKQQHEPFEDHRARAYIAILARDAPLKSPISPTTPGTISGTPLELPAALSCCSPSCPSSSLPTCNACAKRSPTTTPAGAGTLSPPSRHRSTHHASETRPRTRPVRDQHRITRRQAAAAIVDLDSRPRFIATSLLEAVALSAGTRRTPGREQLSGTKRAGRYTGVSRQ
jgi:hypothetical protein